MQKKFLNLDLQRFPNAMKYPMKIADCSKRFEISFIFNYYLQLLVFFALLDMVWHLELCIRLPLLLTVSNVRKISLDGINFWGTSKKVTLQVSSRCHLESKFSPSIKMNSYC